MTKRSIEKGSDLFIRWINESMAYDKEGYVVDFTVQMLRDIVVGYDGGHFAESLYAGDLDGCFNSADVRNLPFLEHLVGMTKQEYAEKHWGWPKS